MAVAASTSQLPHLEVFNRVLELPVIELALSKSASTYTRLKDSHQLLHWALSTAESSISSASRQAAPYAKKFETPISIVDHTLCRGLDKIESKMPLVKEKPEMILENAYVMALEKMRPAVTTISFAHEFLASQASTIKDVSWNKVNQILSTRYGTVAVNSLDNTAFIVEMLIDKYFPPIGEEKSLEPVSTEEDKLLHTLQTVGRLSNKATRRIFANVVHSLRTLKKEHLESYLHNLLVFLQMAHFIDAYQDLKPPSASTGNERNSTRD